MWRDTANINDYYKWSNKEIDKFLNKDQPFFERVNPNTGEYKTVPATKFSAVAKNMVADTQRGGEAFYASSVFDQPVSRSPNLARALLTKNFEDLKDIKANKGLLTTEGRVYDTATDFDLFSKYEDAVEDLNKIYKGKGDDINTEALIDSYFINYRDL